MARWIAPPGSPSARRAFAWPAGVSLAVSVFLAIWMGPLALPILAAGLTASGITAWAQIAPQDAVPRVAVLLLAALIVELAILTHYSG